MDWQRHGYFTLPLPTIQKELLDGWLHYWLMEFELSYIHLHFKFLSSTKSMKGMKMIDWISMELEYHLQQEKLIRMIWFSSLQNI